jgi:hypothetical protein
MKEALRKLAALLFRNFGWKLLALAVSLGCRPGEHLKVQSIGQRNQ